MAKNISWNKKLSAEDAHHAEWYFIVAQYHSGVKNTTSEILCSV